MNNYAEQIIVVRFINSVPNDNDYLHDQCSWLTRTEF